MKCPSCGYISFQNAEECVKCGSPMPPGAAATASDAEYRRGVRRKTKDQLDFSFPADETPAAGIDTLFDQAPAAEGGEGGASESDAPAGEVRASHWDAPTKDRAPHGDAPTKRDATAGGTRPGATTRKDTADDDSSYESGTHWSDAEGETGNTWAEVYKLAGGFGRRAAAMSVDLLVFVALFAALVYVLQKGQDSFTFWNATYIPAYVFLIVLMAFYFTFFHSVTGQTPGKMLLGIRVVNARTAVLLNPWDSFIRWLGYFFSGIPLGLGFVWSVFDDDDRTWHDRWAGSVVVVVDSVRAAGDELPG